MSIDGAKGILFNVTGGKGLGMYEVEDAARVHRRCDQRVARLARHSWQDPPSRRLVERLVDFYHALFTCLSEPGIPPDNNHAERVLRKIVVQRKISGGNRSPTHASIHAKLMSVLETFRLEGGELLPKLQTLFTSRIGELSKSVRSYRYRSGHDS